jgi:hypothetical protein
MFMAIADGDATATRTTSPKTSIKNGINHVIQAPKSTTKRNKKEKNWRLQQHHMHAGHYTYVLGFDEENRADL